MKDEGQKNKKKKKTKKQEIERFKRDYDLITYKLHINATSNLHICYYNELC